MATTFEAQFIGAADRTPATPIAARIEALDVVRGVALFGILLMNITGFGLPEAYTNPQNAGGATGANLWAWIITQVGFEGTQRGLFSLLFGAGVILFTEKLEKARNPQAADLYFRRNLWLVAFGMVNAFLFLWWGDILYTYGITALFLYSFRRLAPKLLIALGLVSLLFCIVWNLHDALGTIAKHDAYVAARAAGGAAGPKEHAAIAAWEETRSEFKAPAEDIARVTRNYSGGWWPAFVATARTNTFFQSWFLYRFFFDAFGMMLIGMGLYKLGVLTLERPARFYWAMALGGYAVGLTVNILETRWILDHNFSALAFAEANITYDLGRLAMTLGHLGALLLFVRSGVLPWLRGSLAAVGQLALTNYLTHSVVCGLIFVGLGWYNQMERHQLYYVVFAIWAVQLIASPIWLRHYRFGPAEWLWRSLTYLKRQPFRR